MRKRLLIKETLDNLDRYEEIRSKTVYDSNGFTTDYTLYFDHNENNYFTVFGDKDIYGPEDEHDWEFGSNEDEALEWFEDYEGFIDTEDVDLELTDDDLEAGQWYESLNEKLIQSSSDKAFKKNVATEIRAGKPQKQAVAIAYDVKRKNEDLADRFIAVHDRDEFNWNLHNTDYTRFYNILKKYIKSGETFDEKDEDGYPLETNVSLKTLFSRMPKSEQEKFMKDFDLHKSPKFGHLRKNESKDEDKFEGTPKEYVHADRDLFLKKLQQRGHRKPIVKFEEIPLTDVKESKELDRKGFASLIKLGEKPYDGYSILNDGYFVKRVYANSDNEAIAQFGEWLDKKDVNESIADADLQDKVKAEVLNKLYVHFGKNGWSKPEVDKYIQPIVKTDFYEEYYDDGSDALFVEVRAELDYDDLTDLAEDLNKVITKYNKYAYFEPVTTGILHAAI